MTPLPHPANIDLRNPHALRDHIDRSLCANGDLADIPRLLDVYANLLPPAPAACDYIRSVRTRLLDLWLAGNRTISRTDIVIGLLKEAHRDIHTLDSRISAYAFSILSDWLRELTLFGSFRTGTPAEHRARLAYLQNARHGLYREF